MSQPAPLPESDDPFALLGVSRGAGPTALRRAYANLIRIWRPDDHPEEFRRIRAAYEEALEQAPAVWEERIDEDDDHSWMTEEDVANLRAGDPDPLYRRFRELAHESEVAVSPLRELRRQEGAEAALEALDGTFIPESEQDIARAFEASLRAELGRLTPEFLARLGDEMGQRSGLTMFLHAEDAHDVMARVAETETMTALRIATSRAAYHESFMLAARARHLIATGQLGRLLDECDDPRFRHRAEECAGDRDILLAIAGAAVIDEPTRAREIFEALRSDAAPTPEDLEDLFLERELLAPAWRAWIRRQEVGSPLVRYLGWSHLVDRLAAEEAVPAVVEEIRADPTRFLARIDTLMKADLRLLAPWLREVGGPSEEDPVDADPPALARFITDTEGRLKADESANGIINGSLLLVVGAIACFFPLGPLGEVALLREHGNWLGASLLLLFLAVAFTAVERRSRRLRAAVVRPACLDLILDTALAPEAVAAAIRARKRELDELDTHDDAIEEDAALLFAAHLAGRRGLIQTV